MQATDRARLQHMLDAAREAQSFVVGKARSELDRDRLLQLGLTRLIEIVGMRNRLIHAYFAVNLDILWDTVTLELPTLIGQLEAMLASEEAAPGESGA